MDRRGFMKKAAAVVASTVAVPGVVASCARVEAKTGDENLIYNPQNEKIVFCKTKRTIPQNEAYPEKSFFDAVEYNKSTLKVAFVSLHDICDTQAATSLVVGSV